MRLASSFAMPCPAPLCSNFGGVLIVWECLFGTFEPEQRSRPCVYGLDASVGCCPFQKL